MSVVPIPETPSGPGALSAIAALLRQVHAQLRRDLDDLDDNATNWVPTPGANSIATIVAHLVGSEAETLPYVAAVECERDRDAEFIGERLAMSHVSPERVSSAGSVGSRMSTFSRSGPKRF